MTRVLRLSLRFLVLYALLQGAFSWTPLNQLVNRLVASIAAPTLSACLDRPVGWSIEGRTIHFIVPIPGTRQAATPNLKESWYTRNIPMFLAIVLAAARTFRIRLLALLGFGLLGVILLDGLIAAHHAWATMPAVAPFTSAYHVLSVFGTWSLGGLSVAPIFLGAIIALRLLGDPAESLEVARPGRNDPCPCGSGLKYKRCCGSKAA